MDLNQCLTNLGVDKELLLEFFVVFSRFEYALKQCEYLRNKETAEPSWEKFAIMNFEKYSGIAKDPCVRYVLANPPQIQIQENLRVSFRTRKFSKYATELLQLLECVKGVRNNLFHGGKYSCGPVKEISRNRELISNSLQVLKKLLELDNHLAEVFYDFKD